MDYRISWQGTRGGVRKALVTRVSSLGTVPPDAELVLAEVPAAAQPLRQDIGSIPMVSGVRVRAADGAVLDPTPILISRTITGPYPLSQTSPAVASDGTNFLVTWTGGVYENEQVYFGIRGMRVRSSDGACIESTSFTIARGATSSRVAYVDGIYLVAFEGGGTGVGATRVSGAGQVLDTTPITLAPISANARTPAVASQSGEFLVTWIGGNGLWARRVRASDGVKLGAADILVGTAAAAAPEVTCDGSDYRISSVTYTLRDPGGNNATPVTRTVDVANCPW